MATQNFRVKNGLEVGTGVTISAGIITATSFVGSGSQLTGVVANYSPTSGVSTSVVGGIASVTNLTVSGVSTFSNTVNIRNGYNLNVGDNNDLRIYNDGTDSRIEETGFGSLKISGSDINIFQHSSNKNFARFIGGGAAELYYNDSKKFSTSGIGVTVTGSLVADSLIKSGGTSSQFLKADGSVDSSTYITSYTETDTLNTVTTRGNSTSNGISVGVLTATSLIKSGGTSSQFLKADGSVDSSTYITSYTETSTLANVTSRGNSTSNGISVGVLTATSLIKSGGTSSQFLKADGSVDSSTYLTSYTETSTLANVTSRGNSTSNGINVGVLTATSVRDGNGNVRAVPQNAQTSAYILAASDVGKHISITTGGVTVNTGIFSVGDAVSIYNNSGSNQTITQGTSVTMYLVGTATTGNRTLAQRGVATILCVGTDTFVVMGGGLT